MLNIYDTYENQDSYVDLITNNKIQGCLFLNNTSQTGGNIYGLYPGKFSLSDCLFLNNSAKIASCIYIEQESKSFVIYFLALK